MKLVGRILTVLLLLGLAVLIGYGVWVYLLPHWLALVFYAYSLCGVGVIVYSIVKGITASKGGTWAERMMRAITRNAQPTDVSSRFARMRDTVSALASVLAFAIVWPVDILYGVLLGRKYPVKDMSLEEVAVLKMSGFSEAIYSLYSLAVVLVLLGLAFLHVVTGLYGNLILACMVANASLRHFSYIVGTVSLPARLRRSGSSPYAIFLVMAAADFSILVLGLTALNLPSGLRAISRPALIATGHQLMEGESALWNILKGGHPSLRSVVVAVVALLFSLALVNVIREFREFKRTDEDYIWMAQAANRLGDFSAALRYLAKVRSWDEKARATEVIAYLGVNEIDKATEKTRGLLDFQHKEITDIAVFTELINGCLLPHVPSNVYLTILGRGIDLKIRDAIVQDCLGLVLQHDLGPQAIALFAAAPTVYPLTVARLALLTGDAKTCQTTLHPDACAFDLDKLIGHVLLFTSFALEDGTPPEQITASFETTAAQGTPLIRKLKEVPGEAWERTLLFEEIQRLLSFARNWGQDRVQELTFLSDSVKQRLTDPEALKRLELVESQMR